MRWLIRAGVLAALLPLSVFAVVRTKKPVAGADGNHFRAEFDRQCLGKSGPKF